MEHQICCAISKEDLVGVYKAIYLFLENQNFRDTCATLQKECASFGCIIPDISFSVKLSQPCKTRCVGSQTEYYCSDSQSECEEFLLESSFYQRENSHQNITARVDDPKVEIAGSTRTYSTINDLPKYEEGDCGDNATVIFPSPTQHQSKMAHNLQCPQTPNVDDIKWTFHSLREEHKKLIAVTAELTNALQSSIVGQTQNYNNVLDQCKLLYPNLFMENKPKVPPDAQSKSTYSPRTSQLSPKDLSIDKHDHKNDQRATTATSEDCEKDGCTCRKDVENILDSLLTSVMKTPRHEEEVASTITSHSKQKEDLPPDVRDVRCQGEGDVSKEVVQDVFALDYEKIKTDLKLGKTDTRLALLQALRWRVSKTELIIGNERLFEYIQNDLLCLNGKDENLADIFFCVDEGANENLMEGFARLVNTFASFTQGRDYLSKKTFLKAIFQLKIFDKKQIESHFTRDMLIATMQKLSLRKPIRQRMINAGLVEDLLDFLHQQYDKLSNYSIEYATALLMNLSLEADARKKLGMKPAFVVNLLKKLLSGKSCCLPYVSGTLYSVLSQKDINKIAREQDLDQNIEEQQEKTTDTHLKRQMDIILKCRFNDEFDELSFDIDEDVKEECDLLESEVDDGDIIISNMPIGEDMLKNYRLHKPKPNRVDCLCHPVTPGCIRLVKNAPEKLVQNEKLLLNSTSNKIFPGSATSSSSPTRSFNEETQQFQSKPTARKGLFENITRTKKFNRLFSMPVSTKKSDVCVDNNKLPSRKKPKILLSGYSTNSVCYLQTPCKLNDPVKNKYTCGCYDAMQKEVNELGGYVDDYGNYHQSSGMYDIPEKSKKSKTYKHF